MPAEFVLLTNVASPVWQRAIGAYQVASHCRKHEITCQVIDFVELFKIAELEEIFSKCINKSTLAVGISTTFFHNKTALGKFTSANRNPEQAITDDIRQLLQKIKSQYPGLKIIGGGANSYQLEGDGLFDAVFHGYSEQSLVEYLQSLKGKLPKRIWPTIAEQDIIDGKTAHFDISTLAHEWHENDCILSGETLPIEVSRGCIFKCTFCSYPLNGKKKFDYLRDPDRIKDELIGNYEKFGTTNYFFADDTFNDSTAKVEALHKIFTSLPFKIKFVTYLRIDLLYAHPEQIVMLKEMGLGSAFFGIETFNHSSGKAIGKGMQPDLVKKFLLELYHNHWNAEIPFTCSFIIGLPHETKESIMETYNWCRTAPFTDLWYPLFITQDSHYKSEFDSNYQDYGYSLDQDGNWTSKHMTYNDAMLLAEEFNQKGIYDQNMPSTWFLFGLLSYGFSINELKDQRISDLHWPRLILKKITLFRQYKEKLLKAIEK